MTVFVSHSRKDGESPEFAHLLHDLERIKHEVWIDKRLTGGQLWWDEILERIRACSVFLVVLSVPSLKSEACRAELQYALSTNRPLLPVQLTRLPERKLPESVARVQIIDYSTRSQSSEAGIDCVFALRDALLEIVAGESPPLPDPLPPDPDIPLSYLLRLQPILDAVELPFSQQIHFLQEIKIHADDLDSEERESLLEALRDFRRRSDIAFTIAVEVDGLITRLSANVAVDPLRLKREESRSRRTLWRKQSLQNLETDASSPVRPRTSDRAHAEPDLTADETAEESAQDAQGGLRTARFEAAGVDVSVIAGKLAEWYESQHLEVQKLDSGSQVVVQCRSRTWTRWVGSSIALSVVLWLDGDDLVVEIGGAKWQERIGPAAAGVVAGVGLLFPYALIPAVVGGSRQAMLPGKTMSFIEAAILNRIESDQDGTPGS
jgi:hypothetical protein